MFSHCAVWNVGSESGKQYAIDFSPYLLQQLEIDLESIGMGFLITVSASSEMVINDSVLEMALLDFVITLWIVSTQQLAFPGRTSSQKWVYFNPNAVRFCGSWLKAYTQWDYYLLVLQFILLICAASSLSNYAFSISPPIS